ncbi:30S ribosomal protein S20 [Algiphilus aromaticivorans]|uniref:30S ribosomal protein S20 n=1 Tax=Algiphilus aromaticivorans TaxID=382454 RepID=UPI0005C1FC29|nr:30S ribosomal protein S20 [Algiphilus aromaticivorans]
MANSPQARKRALQNEKRRTLHASQRSMVRSSIKKVINALEAKNAEAARSAYQEMVPLLDRYAGRGLIHKNKAARHKQRLHKHVRELESA